MIVYKKKISTEWMVEWTDIVLNSISLQASLQKSVALIKSECFEPMTISVAEWPALLVFFHGWSNLDDSTF